MLEERTSPNPYLPPPDSTVLPNPNPQIPSSSIYQIRPSSRITTASDDPLIRHFVSPHHRIRILIDGLEERAWVYIRKIWDVNKLSPNSAGAMFGSPQRCRPPLLDIDKGQLGRIRSSQIAMQVERHQFFGLHFAARNSHSFQHFHFFRF